MRARTRLRLEVERIRRERPPRCPRGWRTGPPDFVGVGTVNAGTTWWHALIRQHPEVHAHPIKELHLLSRPGDPPPSEAETYARWFPRPPGAVAGEWTPDYLYRSHALPRLRAAAPEARLLVLVRDPIERYRSEVTRFSTVPDWSPEMGFRRGCVGEQLEDLFALFPPHQVLVLQYERAVAQPEVELARTFSHLGVEPSFVPRDLRRTRNPTKPAKVELAPSESRALAARYRPDVERLERLCPDVDVGLWSV